METIQERNQALIQRLNGMLRDTAISESFSILGQILVDQGLADTRAGAISDSVVGNDYIATTYYIETDDIPEGYAVGDIKDHGDKGKALNTTAILAHAIKTIQELEARIVALES